MSTRSQVEVVQEGMDWEEKILLYHHSDGYPTNMLPLIKQGYEQVLKKNKKAKKRYGGTGDYYMYEAGRAGKAASFLCAADPGGFEPESGFDLHGDIEWFYVVKVVNKSGGSMAENPQWLVDVYVPPEWEDTPVGEPQRGARHAFWDNPTRAKLKKVASDINVTKMTEAVLRKRGEKLEGRPSKSMTPRTHHVHSSGEPGWYREPARHSLAARGVKTRR